jgi:hypothetical protein
MTGAGRTVRIGCGAGDAGDRWEPSELAIVPQGKQRLDVRLGRRDGVVRRRDQTGDRAA